MIHGFLILATIIFVFLAVIWSTSPWHNLCLKVLFVAMAFVGAHIAWDIFH